MGKRSQFDSFQPMNWSNVNETIFISTLGLNCSLRNKSNIFNFSCMHEIFRIGVKLNLNLSLQSEFLNPEIVLEAQIKFK